MKWSDFDTDMMMDLKEVEDTVQRAHSVPHTGPLSVTRQFFSVWHIHEFGGIIKRAVIQGCAV